MLLSEKDRVDRKDSALRLVNQCVSHGSEAAAILRDELIALDVTGTSNEQEKTCELLCRELEIITVAKELACP